MSGLDDLLALQGDEPDFEGLPDHVPLPQTPLDTSATFLKGLPKVVKGESPKKRPTRVVTYAEDGRSAQVTTVDADGKQVGPVRVIKFDDMGHIQQITETFPEES